MPLYTKSSGTWKTVNKIFVKNASIWKTVNKGWVKDNGIWKQFFSSGFAPITITGSRNNVNLRDEFNDTYPGQTPTGTVQFIANNAQIGSTSTSNYSLVTGSWPNDVILSLTVNSNSTIAGRGGAGGNVWVGTYVAGNGGVGGPAIGLNYNLLLNNSGIIGGGGGGGGGGMHRFCYSGGFSLVLFAGGGGGAGISAGGGGICNAPGNFNTYCTAGGTGSTLAGGAGAVRSSSPWTATGGNGGALGQSGTAGGPGYGNGSPCNITYPGTGGSAGVAIARNGFTLTGSTGDTRGAIT